jgi:hypothetical protein
MTIRFLKPWNGYQPDAVVSGLTNEALSSQADWRLMIWMAAMMAEPMKPS